MKNKKYLKTKPPDPTSQHMAQPGARLCHILGLGALETLLLIKIVVRMGVGEESQRPRNPSPTVFTKTKPPPPRGLKFGAPGRTRASFQAVRNNNHNSRQEIEANAARPTLPNIQSEIVIDQSEIVIARKLSTIDCNLRSTD